MGETKPFAMDIEQMNSIKISLMENKPLEEIQTYSFAKYDSNLMGEIKLQIENKQTFGEEVYKKEIDTLKKAANLLNNNTGLVSINYSTFDVAFSLLDNGYDEEFYKYFHENIYNKIRTSSSLSPSEKHYAIQSTLNHAVKQQVVEENMKSIFNQIFEKEDFKDYINIIGFIFFLYKNNISEIFDKILNDTSYVKMMTKKMETIEDNN
jgi:hypothetical protein